MSYRLPVLKVSLIRESVTTADYRTISDPYAAAQILRAHLDNADREHCVALLLDTRNQVIGIHTVSIGTLNSSLVHPREVFKAAILASAASIILGHNHPSGDPTPSNEDRLLTTRMQEAGKLLGITVLDHVVIGDESRYISMTQAHLF